MFTQLSGSLLTGPAGSPPSAESTRSASTNTSSWCEVQLALSTTASLALQPSLHVMDASGPATLPSLKRSPLKAASVLAVSTLAPETSPSNMAASDGPAWPLMHSQGFLRPTRSACMGVYFVDSIAARARKPPVGRSSSHAVIEQPASLIRQ